MLRPLLITLLLFYGAHHSNAQLFDTSYFADGQIKYVVCWNKNSTKGHASIYDTATSSIKECGRLDAFMGRVGRWREYENGKLVHTTKYKFGFIRDSLWTKDGEPILVYLDYGFGARRGRDCATDQFAMIYAPIALCLISWRVKTHAAIHNFLNDAYQVTRFGFGWRNQYEMMKESCN